MRSRGRGWFVDDWFRPVRRDGTTPSPRRAVTPRDRLGMLTFACIGLVAVTAVFLHHTPGRAAALSGGLVGVVLVQLVSLHRTRSIGFGLRRH